jgi:lysyl-tRNA synthetase class 2
MSEEKTVYEIRLEKLQRMRELGYDPYKIERFERTHTAHQLIEDFEKLQSDPVRYAGRIVSIRQMGKAIFMHVNDGSSKFQIYLKKDDLGETLWEVAELLDIGDHLGVSGELFITKMGEKTIHVREMVPLSKCFHVLPVGKEKDGERWYGVSDIEYRYRHRHVDLICNPEARSMLLARMRIISAVRRYLDNLGYVEAETPYLQLVAGGAAAKPFLTHYNAYNLDVKLRISIELYLKRLICGDIPKVYEIGRVFRNEGVSNRHNPEFTMLEYYEAYANLEDMMENVEGMFRYVTQEVFGTSVIEREGVILDFSKPWQRVDLLEEIEKHTGVKPEELAELESARRAMQRLGLPTEGEDNLGGIIEKILECFVEPHLVQPTFVIRYPVETSPLAKRDPNNPHYTRRFEGYVCCREICNAFSELNDPLEQRERFEQQARERARGDEHAHPMDEDFLFALETGMPPTGGCGIGMDRMAMILTGAESLREVLLFPMMKPEKHEETP